jgi:L-lysine exporter family protein LysE/ArgO
MTSPWIALLRGAGLSASLITAIGAQNAYVLRQGLRRTHVLAVVLLCAGSDALLISIGVGGAGAVLTGAPLVMKGVRWAGAAYLVAFAISALRRALGRGDHGLLADATQTQPLAATLATTLALTYLNPHVYLDTVVMLGAVGAREPAATRGWFVGGAIGVSFVWFFSLGYGARLLAPLLARPLAWRLLDGAIAVVVLTIAISLARG